MNTQANREALLTLKKTLPETPRYKDVEEGTVYLTERYKQIKQVWVVEVKTNKIKLKRSRDAVDSFTISRAEFDKYYKKV